MARQKPVALDALKDLIDDFTAADMKELQKCKCSPQAAMGC